MKFYLREQYNQPTQYFDYVGSSAWSIRELFENDFEDHVKKEDIAWMVSVPGTSLFGNTRYYLRYAHDFHQKIKKVSDLSPNILNPFQSKYERRKERLIEILKDLDNPILFFRLDEPFVSGRRLFGPISKVFPEEIREDSDQIKKERVANFEYENFCQALDLIRSKYNRRNFAVIYVSHCKQNQLDLENQTIILHQPDIMHWKEVAGILDNLFCANSEFIIDGLTQILNRFTDGPDQYHDN